MPSPMLVGNMSVSVLLMTICTEARRVGEEQQGCLRSTSLEGDGRHPLTVTGERVDLHNLVGLLQGAHLHPQLAAQLQQGALCAVAHSHKPGCIPTHTRLSFTLQSFSCLLTKSSPITWQMSYRPLSLMRCIQQQGADSCAGSSLPD